jgi:hypothetical protein
LYFRFGVDFVVADDFGNLFSSCQKFWPRISGRDRKLQSEKFGGSSGCGGFGLPVVVVEKIVKQFFLTIHNLSQIKLFQNLFVCEFVVDLTSGDE